MHNNKNITEYTVHPLFAKRWSPRAFDARPIDREIIMSIFEAGRWAASAYNEQPWRFIVGYNQDTTHAKIVDVLDDFNTLWAPTAPLLVLTLIKKDFTNPEYGSNYHALHDLGMATAHMTLQALEHEVYAHHMAGFDREKAHTLFTIPEGYEPATIIAFGYAGDAATLPEGLQQAEQAPRTRKDFSEFIFQETFGQSASL
ncbi:MAG: nitroreductase family protein [Candidatus Pacebacteria bacterium]|nr:nitroreductase family protein [Candidatus Paceibacterota bacterium]MCD8507854.1 nitroreductase family protein [Candidatus Paceibacterota bacterium]MCD8527828.1 nitroreductase family protein [Candidatus Paceibacterota bacterium]MCD8563533.1 nitroreductase family protein [Candidatus Paceibacterota bacterium]